MKNRNKALRPRGVRSSAGLGVRVDWCEVEREVERLLLSYHPEDKSVEGKNFGSGDVGPEFKEQTS